MRTLKALSIHPHEDPNILHEPGSCEECDKFPERQQLRVMARINFTGCNVKGWLPDPSETLKPVLPKTGNCSTHGRYIVNDVNTECARCVEEKRAEKRLPEKFSDEELEKEMGRMLYGYNNGYNNIRFETTTTNQGNWSRGYSLESMTYSGQISHWVGNNRYQHAATETCTHCVKN